MEPLQSPQLLAGAGSFGRKSPAALASASASSASASSTLASFAKQQKQQNEVVLGPPVANNRAPLARENVGNSGKQLSGLASFAKSHQPPSEPLKPSPSSSSSGHQSASLLRELPLAAFAKSLVPSSSPQPASGTTEKIGALRDAASSSSKPGPKRLSLTTKPPSVRTNLAPLPLPDAQGLAAENSTSSQAKGVRHNSVSSPVRQTLESEAKERSPIAATNDDNESSNGFSNMDETNFLYSDDEEGDDSDNGFDSKETSTREAKSHLDAQTVDTELYTSRDHSAQTKLLPRIFVPKASEIPLFHAVVTADTALLDELLAKLTPEDILSIRDNEERSLYHYAAVSLSKNVRAHVFSFVTRYFDEHLDQKISKVMAKTSHMNAWMEKFETTKSTWIPPRVRELQRQTIVAKHAALLHMCECVDRNDRSLFHYMAASKAGPPIEMEKESHLRRVLEGNLKLFSSRDACEKTPLHYAVEHGNACQLQWFFQIGAANQLKSKDIESLLHLNASKGIRALLLREVEALDAINYRIQSDQIEFNDDEDNANTGDNEDDVNRGNEGTELGVSVFLAAKLERDVASLSGPLLQSPLLKAAMFGNCSAVELLLAKNADASARDANGWTALHYCASGASRNHLRLAQFLLQEAPKQVKINARSAKGRTALHVTANGSRKYGISEADTNVKNAANTSKSDAKRAQMVVLLCANKASLDLQDDAGATALLLAARRNNVHVARLLLEKGCSPVLFDNAGSSPLQAAVSRGHIEMTAFLTRWDADRRFWSEAVDNQGRKPMDVAKNEQMRRALVNLWNASYSGEIEHVKHLLQCSKQAHEAKQETTNQNDWTKLISVHDQTLVTRRSALHLAMQGYSDVLSSSTLPQQPSLFATAAATVKEKKRLAKLATAREEAPNRFLQVAHLLIKTGAAELSHMGDRWGITPLMLAATIKDEVYMEMLLDACEEDEEQDIEASLAAKDCDGNTALHYTYAFGLAQISNLLEERMDDTEIVNNNGKTPLEVTGLRSKLFPEGFRDHCAQLEQWRQQQ